MIAASHLALACAALLLAAVMLRLSPRLRAPLFAIMIGTTIWGGVPTATPASVTDYWLDGDSARN